MVYALEVGRLMGKDTAIEWAHHTKNLWWGCTEVSEECEDCYAEVQSTWLGFKIWGADSPRRLLKQQIEDVLMWDVAAKHAGEQHRVFWESMGDIMEDRRELDAPRKLAFDVMERTPNLIHLLLTKRPQNYMKLLPAEWLVKPRANVWGGTTVGLEKSMWRVLGLVMTPFARRFISHEPAIGPCDFSPYLRRIDWIISGGKSGRRRPRPAHPQWFRDVRDDCCEAGIAWFFKQWGEYLPFDQREINKNQHWSGAVKTIQMRDGLIFDGEVEGWASAFVKMMPAVGVGKKIAGRRLDGVEYSQIPLVAA